MKKASANQFTPNVNWRAICIGFFVAIMIVSISSSFSRFLYSDSLHNRANTTSPRAAGAPGAPSLNLITPNPNYNGHINLTWSSSPGATTYYLYRNTSSFIVTTGLTPINSTGSTSVQDTIVINGTYFYAVVAGNSSGNSSLSSCQSVAVKLILFF
ncbi:MAG TPA: hypothetical protein VKK79_05350, partial [Candidatus Lokiarchaeia archaeon]|nr:hypothetical protein [Candidatus Lokiarchaeia archaeon]